MTVERFNWLLRELGITKSECARLMSVAPRTIRGWLSKEGNIPIPAQCALLAWKRLHDFGLAWRSDVVYLAPVDNEVIRRIMDEWKREGEVDIMQKNKGT